MAKLWELIDGKCYCNGHLMSDAGCHGANCRTCCYNLGLLTTIDNVPLFSTIKEAENWGNKYSLKGYHTHDFDGTTGYMSGSNHDDVQLAMKYPSSSVVKKDLKNRMSNFLDFGMKNLVNNNGIKVQPPEVEIPVPAPTATPTPETTPTTDSDGGY